MLPLAARRRLLVAFPTTTTASRARSTANASAAPVHVAFRPLADPASSNGARQSCVALVTMNSPKANTFDFAALSALDSAIAQVECAENVRGLVLGSAVNGIYSGGFHLPIFHQITEGDFLRLWALTKSVFRRIHALPVPSIAAIDGHALGLGCALALACQSRFMVKDTPATIGLNEVAVGMPVPAWLALRYRNLTSPQTAERLLPIGASLSAAQACEIGLVDATFKSRESLYEAAIEQIQQASKASPLAQAETIRNLRREYLDKFDAGSKTDTDQFWHAISRPETQQRISNALARIKKKAASKKSR
ncbi:hypothetical protein GGI12_001782 [Dipsacomyces acuminosporus]|nr:hypothetical protein GGI12_001782 [Dipsacomyces acuminosporus]